MHPMPRSEGLVYVRCFFPPFFLFGFNEVVLLTAEFKSLSIKFVLVVSTPEHHFVLLFFATKIPK